MKETICHTGCGATSVLQLVVRRARTTLAVMRRGTVSRSFRPTTCFWVLCSEKERLAQRMIYLRWSTVLDSILTAMEVATFRRTPRLNLP